MFINFSLGGFAWVVRPPGYACFFNLAFFAFLLDGLVGLDRSSSVPSCGLLLFFALPAIIFRCTLTATQAGFYEWTYEIGVYSPLGLVKPDDLTQMSISYTQFSFFIGSF